MRKSVFVLALSALTAVHAHAQQANPDRDAQRALEGRWDLVIRDASGEKPGWLEVSHSGPRTLVGRFTASSGSARPIAKVDFRGGELRFAIPPQWESGDGDLTVVGRMANGRLAGTLTYPDGKRAEWTGVRAPDLRREREPVWGTPIALLANGLSGWKVIGGANEWEVVNGVLRNRKSGGNLMTEQKFEDFKLHLEFRVPEGSNSGVYLRGRYEVQITDSEPNEQGYGVLGALYGYLPPTSLPAKPGEWQTFDITLVGRLVTIALNGKTITSEAVIPGITGGALDSDEGAPGPLVLQGDHGSVEFRNITITPAR